jgi:hypothetical protein
MWFMFTLDVLDLHFGLFTDKAITIPPNLQLFNPKKSCKVDLQRILSNEQPQKQYF